MLKLVRAVSLQADVWTPLGLLKFCQEFSDRDTIPVPPEVGVLGSNELLDSSQLILLSSDALTGAWELQT